jgi:hypothetical protein
MWHQSQKATRPVRFRKSNAETDSKGRIHVDRARALVRRADTTWDGVIKELRARCTDLITIAANAGITRIKYKIPLHRAGQPIYYNNMQRVADGLIEALVADGYTAWLKENTEDWVVIIDFSKDNSSSTGGRTDDKFSRLIRNETKKKKRNDFL